MAARRRWIVVPLLGALAVSIVVATLALAPTSTTSKPRVPLTSAQLPSGWRTYLRHTGPVDAISSAACRRAAASLYGATWSTAEYVSRSSEVFVAVGTPRWEGRRQMLARLDSVNALRSACGARHGLGQRALSPCVPLARAVGMATARDDAIFVPLQLRLPTYDGPTIAQLAGHGEVTSVQEGTRQSALAATYLWRGRFVFLVAVMTGAQVRPPRILREVLRSA